MTVNVELLQETLDTIKAKPQHWNQHQWHCGTSHCFAGFAQLIHHGIPVSTSEEDLADDPRLHGFIGLFDWKTSDDAAKLLGLYHDDADELFASSNTLEDLERMVAQLIENGYIADGDEGEDESCYDNEGA